MSDAEREQARTKFKYLPYLPTEEEAIAQLRRELNLSDYEKLEDKSTSACTTLSPAST